MSDSRARLGGAAWSGRAAGPTAPQQNMPGSQGEFTGLWIVGCPFSMGLESDVRAGSSTR